MMIRKRRNLEDFKIKDPTTMNLRVWLIYTLLMILFSRTATVGDKIYTDYETVPSLVRQNYPLFFLIILRLFLMFIVLRNWHHLSTDASTIGTMAIDILNNRAHPFYIYWQVYNGAASFRAHLIAFIMSFTGVTPWAVMAVPLSLDVIIMILTFKFVNRWFNQKIAIMTTLLYIFTPPIVMHIISGLAGYLETIIFNIIMCHIFFMIISGEETNRKTSHFFLLGIIAGFSYYLFELTLVFILTMLLWFFVFDKLFLLKKFFLSFLPGFVIGNLPAIYFNIVNDYANWKYIWGLKTNISSVFLPKIWWIRLLSPLIMAFLVLKIFGWRIIVGFFEIQDEGITIAYNRYQTIITDFAQLLIYLFCACYFLYLYKKDIFSYVKQLFNYRKYSEKTAGSFKYIFLLIFIILQVLASLNNLQGYRFFYPIFPFITILLSELLIKARNKKTKLIAALIFTFLVLDGGYKYYLVSNTRQICMNFSFDFSKMPPITVMEERCGIIEDVIDFLDEQKIKFVLAPYHATPITFYSGGRIIGSIYGFSSRINQRDNPERYSFGQFAILVYKDSIFDSQAQRFLIQKGLEPNIKIFDTLKLYYPIEREHLFPLKAEFIPE